MLVKENQKEENIQKKKEKFSRRYEQYGGWGGRSIANTFLLLYEMHLKAFLYILFCIEIFVSLTWNDLNDS